jgi:hypothetical protein
MTKQLAKNGPAERISTLPDLPPGKAWELEVSARFAGSGDIAQKRIRHQGRFHADHVGKSAYRRPVQRWYCTLGWWTFEKRCYPRMRRTCINFMRQRPYAYRAHRVCKVYSVSEAHKGVFL